MPYSGSASVVKAKRQAHWLRVRDEEIAKRHAAIGPRPTCEMCAGFLSRKARHGVCQRNPECFAENRRRQMRVHRASDPERIRQRDTAASKRYRHSHPDKVRTWKSSDYARRKANGFRTMLINEEYLWAAQGGLCFLCIEPMQRNDTHLDHYVPLARGGRHEYGNTYLTHPVCNLRKHAKIPADNLARALISDWSS